MCFVKQNGDPRYKYLVLDKKTSSFVREHTSCSNKYNEDDILKN